MCILSNMIRLCVRPADVFCAKAKRQQHVFVCAKAKRQQQHEGRHNVIHFGNAICRSVSRYRMDAMILGEYPISTPWRFHRM